MEAKHTPGPWLIADKTFVYALNQQGYNRFWAPVTGGHVARMELTEASELEANARLIAAAPELLEAAKMVIAWYEAEDDHSKADFYERMQMCRDSESALRAAIAKATGAQS